MADLSGKVAIITGAGRLRGIGRAAAVALAQDGADIVITGTGRSPDSFPEDEKQVGWKDIESTAEQVRDLGRECLPLICNAADSNDVNSVVKQTMDKFGRVDILVNNAAFARAEDRVPVVDMDDEIFKKVIDIKVIGGYLFAKAVAKILIAQDQGGQIINLSSTAGRQGSARTSAYNTANFALHGFTQALAQELAPNQITVNAVCPGPVTTARMDVLGDKGWEATLSRIPMGRAATDEDIAGVVRWLCSPEASLITGQHININGGTVMD